MKPTYTFYDTLQVSRSANDAALVAAFKTLCEKHHPDKDPEDLSGATPEMLQLSEAYAVLSDSEKRFAYDLFITKRERELRAEEEAKAAKAAASMFPPIVMPADLPELPAVPALSTTLPTTPPAAAQPAAAAAASRGPAAPPAPVKVAPPPAAPPRKPPKRAPGALDFEPTTVQMPPGAQSGFADTQPQMEADPAQVCTVRETPVPVPGHPAVEWLRERPLALLGVRVFHVATQSKEPVIQDLHPTYVEPPAVPALAASAALPAELPAVAPAVAASESASAAVGASAPVAEAAALGAGAAVATAVAAAPPAKAAPRAKRPTTPKVKPAAAPSAPPQVAPARAPEPAPAPPVLDPGGHTGFAPKCRWVTPTKWSCD